MEVFQPPPLYSTLLFIALLSVCQAVVVLVAGRAGAPVGRARRSGIALAIVVVTGGLTAALSAWVLDPEVFAPTALTLVSLNVIALVFAFRPIGLAMGMALPMGGWVLFHVFRLPLECLLAVWQAAGTIPEQLSWEGQNLDVITGVLALAVGPILLRWPNKKLAVAFHAVGLGLLFNVARIAILSAPGAPFDVFAEPVLLAFHFPFIWIVPFAVVTALFTHVIALRALLSRELLVEPASKLSTK